MPGQKGYGLIIPVRALARVTIHIGEILLIDDSFVCKGLKFVIVVIGAVAAEKMLVVCVQFPKAPCNEGFRKIGAPMVIGIHCLVIGAFRRRTRSECITGVAPFLVSDGAYIGTAVIVPPIKPGGQLRPKVSFKRTNIV